MLKHFLWLLLLTTTISPSFAANKRFVVSIVAHPATLIYKPIIERAYADIGIDVIFVELPSERRLIELNQGVIDADLGARELASEAYPNIIKIEPKLASGSIELYCRQPKPCNESVFSDPNASIYATTGGFIVLNTNTQLNIKAHLTSLENGAAILEMFNSGRINYFVDVFIDNKAEPVPADDVAYNKVSLTSSDYFHYINKRHADIAEALSASLAHQLELYQAELLAQ